MIALWAVELPSGGFSHRPPVSLHIRSRFLRDCVLAKRVPTDCAGILHLDHVALSGSPCGGVFGGTDQQPGAHLRRRSGCDRLCKWAMDERRRLPSHS